VTTLRRSRKLSPHFSLGEFYEAGHAPPVWIVPALEELCSLYLEPLRRAYGATTVHSGWRSQAHNAAVGGAPASFHMGRRTPTLAAAADVSCRTGTPREWYAALLQLGPGGLGLYSTHVHVDNRPGQRARW